MQRLKLRTLIITKDVPFPIQGGSSLRLWQLLNLMAKRGPVALFSSANWTPKPLSHPLLTQWEHCNVEENRTPWEKLARRLWWLCSDRHPNADWGYCQQAAQQLKELLTTFKPDLVILEQVWVYPYLNIVQNYPCQIIADHQNIEFNLYQQIYLKTSSLKTHLKQIISQDHLYRMEKKLCQQVHQNWVCSKQDGDLLQKLYGQFLPVKIIANGLKVDEYRLTRKDSITSEITLPEHCLKILFLGQLSYPPNVEAVEILLTQIYPRLQERYPDCRLLLVGRSPTPRMLQAAQNNAHIIVTGTVKDVRPYLTMASLQVIPLQQGGGTRLKILEAWAAGCPVISTAKGAEGLLNSTLPLKLADSPAAMVEAVISLWENPEQRSDLVQAGYEHVKKYYDWSAINQALTQAIKEL